MPRTFIPQIEPGGLNCRDLLLKAELSPVLKSKIGNSDDFNFSDDTSFNKLGDADIKAEINCNDQLGSSPNLACCGVSVSMEAETLTNKSNLPVDATGQGELDNSEIFGGFPKLSEMSENTQLVPDNKNCKSVSAIETSGTEENVEPDIRVRQSTRKKRQVVQYIFENPEVEEEIRWVQRMTALKEDRPGSKKVKIIDEKSDIPKESTKMIKPNDNDIPSSTSLNDVSIVNKKKDKEQKTKEKKTRKKRDPNAPKGAKTSFTFYATEKRGELKPANPGASFGELSALIAESWKHVEGIEKKKFEDLAKLDKIRHARDLSIYKDILLEAEEDEAEFGADKIDSESGDDDDSIKASKKKKRHSVPKKESKLGKSKVSGVTKKKMQVMSASSSDDESDNNSHASSMKLVPATMNCSDEESESSVTGSESESDEKISMRRGIECNKLKTQVHIDEDDLNEEDIGLESGADDLPGGGKHQTGDANKLSTPFGAETKKVYLEKMQAPSKPKVEISLEMITEISNETESPKSRSSLHDNKDISCERKISVLPIPSVKQSNPKTGSRPSGIKKAKFVPPKMNK